MRTIHPSRAMHSSPAMSIANQRSCRGARSHRTGLVAEDAVARHYEDAGRAVTARRWRGQGGEIDLVATDGDGVIFVEVKRARSFAQAAESLTRRQMSRVLAAGSEYLARMPLGQLTNVRFDLAMVDGAGRVEVLENAFTA